MGLSFLAEYLP